MVHIRPFLVEQWMDRLETTPGVLNIAETCCHSLSVQELIELSPEKSENQVSNIFTKQMTYGTIPGSEETRQHIANLYNEGTNTEPLSPSGVLLMQGAIAANSLTLNALISPGDHVVCVHPTYQQLYEIPRSLGADVTLWKLEASNGYVPKVEDLEAMITDRTKMIIINNPNNPTGATIPEDILQEIVQVAKAKNIIVMTDEVYRPLYHSLPSRQKAPPSILSLGYKRTISTSSMSKAYSLAGIRVGWIASHDEGLIEAISDHRHYTTISVSQLDDAVAGYALSPKVLPNLLDRNMKLARTNLALVEGFVKSHSSICSWVKPTAGTTAMIQFKKGEQPVDDGKFCHEILENTKVLMMPGSICFGDKDEFAGYMRIGYVSSTEVLQEALKSLGAYLKNKFEA